MEHKRYNVVRLYKVGNCYKLVGFKHSIRENIEKSQFKGQKNSKKLENNVKRAKSVIFELAFCNKWEFFCTFTIDGSKFSRNDLKSFYKSFSKFINNWSQRKSVVKYLLIPELHSDNENWHLHGLVKGLPLCYLSPFERGKHPQRLVDGGYLNWGACSSRFGFCSLAPVRNSEAVSKYVTKYITKELLSQSREVGCHLYYCSKGLDRKQLKADVSMVEMDIFDFDYENEYVKVKTVEESEVEKIYEFMRLLSIEPLRHC